MTTPSPIHREVPLMSEQKIIIAGHSHIVALLGGCEEEVLSPVEGWDRFFGLHGPWPRTEHYWESLNRYAPGNSIALLWRGNEHNELFIFEQSPRFDFVPKQLQELPVADDAVIVPSALVQDRLRYTLNSLHDVLVAARQHTDCRIGVVGTPPPKGDSDFLYRFVEQEFAPVLKHFGIQASDIRLTAPIIRLKLWHVLQALYKEQAEQDDVEFLPVPEAVKDQTGFLKPEFWAEDVTHANSAYGQIMLKYLAEQL